MRSVLVALLMVNFSAFFTVLNASENQRYRVYTEEYPPFNYREGERVIGKATDIVLEVVKTVIPDFKRDEINLVPWARGYNRVQTDPFSMLYSIARSPDREELFQWICPVGCIETGLLARKDEHMVIRSSDDLEKYRIGVVREDIGHQLLLKILPEKDLDITNSSEANLRKLVSGRIDLFSYDINTARFTLSKLGINPDAYEMVYSLGKTPLCLAVHREMPLDLVERMRKSIKRIAEERNIHSCSVPE